MTGKARAGIIRFMVVSTLLMRFFRRTLIQYGALRSGMVRWSLTALAAAWMVFSCVVAYFFLRPLGADRDKWSMMLDLSWVSTIPWVIGVFLLVKMLFSKADGALRIVSGLPVTGILRGLTIKASEMGVVLAAVTVSVFSISVSLLLSTGVDAIGLACLHLLLPALLLYAMLSLAWDLIGRAMRMLGLPQFASVTAICGLVAMLVGYAMLVLPLVMDIQERWLGGDDAILWATVVGDLAVRIGGLPTGIGASALLLAVTLADVAVSPPRYREQADYLPIHCPAAGRGDITMFAAYVLRSKDTFLESILAAALAIVLCVRGDTGFATLPACIVTFTGLSQFANGIVAIWNLHRGSAAYTYLCMICSQLAVYVPIWLAISLLTLPWGGPTPLGCLYSLAGIVAGSIVCTMLGIVFPMTKHNPLTAIVGLGSFALAGTLLLFAIGLLDLRGPILAVVLVAILAAMILYSILGIQTHQRSMRYEHR